VNPESVIGWGMMAGSLALCMLWLVQIRRVQERIDDLEQRLARHRRYLDLLQLHRDCKPEEWLE
jgi:hypothetical protein